MAIVVFDIGGVLIEDIWETMFLDPEAGFVNKFNLNRTFVKDVGTLLFEKYSIISGDNKNWQEIEKSYWQEVISILSIQWSISDCIEYSKQFIRPIPKMDELLSELINNKIELGAYSNQTVFWFERQLQTIDSVLMIPREKMVLSFEIGLNKDNELLEILDRVKEKMRADVGEIIIVDDRVKHINKAKNVGFITVHFETQNKNAVAHLRNHLIQLGALNI